MLAFLLAGGGALLAPMAVGATAALPLSPVIWTENPQVVHRFAIDPELVRDMVNRALLKLTSAPDTGTAWRRLGILPSDVVGIKMTTQAGPLLSTHRAVVQAVCDGLHAAGLDDSHILLWDKQAETMRAAGYVPRLGSSFQVGITSVFPDTGYDPNVTYKNNDIGQLIWGDFGFVRNSDSIGAELGNQKPYRDSEGNGDANSAPDPVNGAQTSNLSHYARLVSEICTKIINIPALTDNREIGISGCLGSLALGSVDNNRRFTGEPSYGDPAIAEILSPAFFRRKVVVHILDALIPEYAGGPFSNPVCTQPIGAIYVSRDPVAIDWLVRPRLERWRVAAKIDPIGRTADHIEGAALANLGTDDPSRIQLIHLP